MSFVTNWLSGIGKDLYWVMMHMDVTQWGIISAIFVVVGFLALRTRL